MNSPIEQTVPIILFPIIGFIWILTIKE